ncbi:creatinine amidohydrolase/Fe(II)-dependent formamide hydrolase-like protein [Rhizomicrobium palustre]|uniref:Creatinine amidohydrolase/Fe(II)-dependent formamide hydrolase-like protein n=1 Tax=Rhizomicrobium palustre TaxID=189966 RepID=A0A846N3X6_9PROT|nr:creatininase family protein [Rhizomicrobium palustre]NIK90436.1 creatinine amidohydrolase/Fe(II)-dependent formamide hydrolase-like protein [Rhizomicrobium palustre]
MQLHLSTWPEIESYLQHSKAILVPIGSTEQHGPIGLLGTDALCSEEIARRAGEEGGFLVAPTFNVGQAQHHLAFPGTLTLRPSTMIAAMTDWANSLRRHGFERIYWLNGHGGNVATMNAAFAEIQHGSSINPGHENSPTLRCSLRNWWELAGVSETIRELFPVGEGNHATPSEISVTQYLFPQAVKYADFPVRIAPSGPIFDAEDFRRRYPDGRIGSDPTLANPAAGKRLVETAVHSLVREFRNFAGA